MTAPDTKLIGSGVTNHGQHECPPQQNARGFRRVAVATRCIVEAVAQRCTVVVRGLLDPLRLPRAGFFLDEIPGARVA